MANGLATSGAPRAVSARRLTLLVAAAAAVLPITACLPPAVVIPDGETNVVHVHVAPENVQLDPETAEAGDVYFVIEGPGMEFSLVRWLGAPDAVPRGLTPAEIARLRQGDYQFMQLEAYGVSCGEDEWTEERHWEGCREVVLMSLTPGLYAIMGNPGDPGAAPIMAVLEVGP